MPRLPISLLLFGLLAPSSAASAATRQVGPGRTYATPSAAAAAAQDGDIIEIDAGLYRGDVVSWQANNLTIRGVGGGRAHLEAAGQAAESKGIWVTHGANTTIENIEFSGATVPDENGAGIRHQGTGLTVRNCYFHDNQNGILSGGGGAADDIVIESSIFEHNGAGDGYTHNMYIGNARSFTLRFSHTHDAVVGHTVKSRALKNIIAYNRITEEDGGDSSYEIDLPNGGEAYIIGNMIHQGPSSGNPAIISFAAEGASNPTQALYVVNNTIVNDRGSGTFVVNRSAAAASLFNNLFIGGGTVLSGPGTETSDLSTSAAILVNRAGFDYRLLPSAAAAIDQGTDPGSAGGFALAPIAEYVQQALGRPRVTMGSAIDLGAFELGNPNVADAGPGIDGGSSVDASGADSGRRDGGPPPGDAAPRADATEPGPDAGAPRLDASSLPGTDGGVGGRGATGGCGCEAVGDSSTSGAWLAALALIGVAWLGSARFRR